LEEVPDLGHNAVADVEDVDGVAVDDLALALGVGVLQGVDPLVARARLPRRTNNPGSSLTVAGYRFEQDDRFRLRKGAL